MNNTEDVRIAFPKLIIASDTILLIVALRIMWKNIDSFVPVIKLQIRLHTSCHAD